MDRWTPSGSGAAFKLNTITASLEPYKKYVTSFGNIKNDAVKGTQHVINPATWLSSVRPDLSVPGVHISATLDQVIAGHVGHETPFPSLEVSSDRTSPANPPSTTPGPYTGLSFRDANTPMPMEFNPRTLFLRLFGNPDRETVSKETASLLDNITERTRELQRDLNPGDRAVLDSYLTSVREVELKLQSSPRNLGDLKLPPLPKGVLDSFDEQVQLMFDLIALGYRADMTRVVSFMMATERTNQTYNHIGVPDSFHPISHHANNLPSIEKLVKIQTWHMERFAAFLGALAAIPDGEGTLLDNAMFLYGSNMSNSDRHDEHPLPTLLIGGGAGKLNGGRHIALREPTPITNLHLALLGKVGLERQSFGDSTGTISL